MLDVKTEKEIDRKLNFKLKIHFHQKPLQQPFFENHQKKVRSVTRLFSGWISTVAAGKGKGLSS